MHLLAGQKGRAVVRVILAPVDGMHERRGAMVYRGDQLAQAVGVLNQAPQLRVEGPIPCNAVATCMHAQAVSQQDEVTLSEMHSTGVG